MNREFEELTRLLLLRALHFKDCIYRFVGKDGFSERHVARLLNLNHWLGENENGFITEAQCPKWNRREVMKELNQQWQAAEAKKSDTLGPPHFEANCQRMAKVFGLNQVDLKILRLKVIEAQGGCLGDVLYDVCEQKNRKSQIELVAAMLRLPIQKVNGAVSVESRLNRLKIIEWESGGKSTTQFIIKDSNLAERICNSWCSIDDIIRDIVTVAKPTNLTYSDYPHLTKTLAPLRRHIRRTLKTGASGINVFVYGPPGTGKSELIKVIAREMRAQLYEIACEDENREAVGPYGRTDAVVRAIEIMRGRRALLLFDEAEDIFSSASFFSKSFASERKGWTNRMLENNPVPVFWISNNIRNLDPAFSRRFDFIFQVKPPPRHQRKQVYRKICGSHAPADLIEKIAASEVLTPAVVARATKVAVSTCQRGNLDDFRQIFEERLYQTLKAQGHNAHTFMKSLSIVPAVYGLDFLNASMDLHSLAPALKQRPDCRICLYGPSGTGKTTLGHWLSEATNRPIHVKKASDLLTPYLGETEQALARAFENAEQDGAILMIDEVDSFLQDRRSAERSWEVQQVNELLTQMERFSGTFIASTNLIDSIDAAAFRRFDFKLRFDYLKQEQVTGLFERYSDQLGLGCSGRAASRKMGELGNCTPGDFANVARQHRVQPFMDADAFAQAIIGECQQKNQSAGRKLGFL